MLSKAKIKSELRRLNEILTLSFGHVKQDTQSLFEWISYLNHRAIQQDQLISQLNHQLSLMPKSREEIKQIIDQYYSYENFHKKITGLDSRVTSLIELQKTEIETIKRSLSFMPNNQAVLNKVHEIDERLGYIESRKKPSIKERIVKKITRNSKDYVKNTIISLIRKYGKATGLQLKEIIVDEQALCSKSSFYRLLEEVESFDEISVARAGKEKHYLYKAVKHA